MMTSSDSGHAVAGGLARHIPVLIRPAVELLDVRSGGVYVDATFGAGGYTVKSSLRRTATSLRLTATRARSRAAPILCRRRKGGWCW